MENGSEKALLRGVWLSGLAVLALAWFLYLTSGCGYSEAEMQVRRDEAKMLRRAIAACEETTRDYLGALEQSVKRCQEQTNAESRP